MTTKDKSPHPSHDMGKYHTEIRAPAGTERFYGVRKCKVCSAEQLDHPAGHFMDEELKQPCMRSTLSLSVKRRLSSQGRG